MDIQIRAANEKDYDEIINLYGDFVNDLQRYKNLDNDSYLEFIKSPNAFLDVATAGAKIVGFISYSTRVVVRYPRPILEVEEFYVHPNFRRHGVGRKLIEHVSEYAKSTNCHYIFLATSKEREDAHKFYEALGFDKYAYHYRRKL